jgi:molybdenum cofactor cytidylyltransferase
VTVFVTGLVLAAGGSSRLGRPKQLLPFRGGPLLQSSVDIARTVGFDQLLVTVGAAADEVEAAVDLEGVEVVRNPRFESGCSSSITAALGVVDDASTGIVLMLGDQPGVRADTISRLVAGAAAGPLGVCRYADGRGHPLWLGRAVFDELATLHGDKGVWKLVESGRHTVVDVDIAGPVPVDVDTWDDYERLLEQERAEESI